MVRLVRAIKTRSTLYQTLSPGRKRRCRNDTHSRMFSSSKEDAHDCSEKDSPTSALRENDGDMGTERGVLYETGYPTNRGRIVASWLGTSAENDRHSLSVAEGAGEYTGFASRQQNDIVILRLGGRHRKDCSVPDACAHAWRIDGGWDCEGCAVYHSCTCKGWEALPTDRVIKPSEVSAESPELRGYRIGEGRPIQLGEVRISDGCFQPASYGDLCKRRARIREAIRRSLECAQLEWGTEDPDVSDSTTTTEEYDAEDNWMGAEVSGPQWKDGDGYCAACSAPDSDCCSCGRGDKKRVFRGL